MIRHSDVKPRLASRDERPTVFGTSVLVIHMTLDVPRVPLWSNPRLGESPWGPDRSRAPGRNRADRTRTARRMR